MNLRLPTAAALAVGIWGLAGAAGAQDKLPPSLPVLHPLDALVTDEYVATLDALKSAGKTTENSKFVAIRLLDPRKEDVLAWKPGKPIPRSAFVVVQDGAKVFEGTVDLAVKGLTSWKEIPGVQTSFLFGELHAAQEVTLHDAGWRAAMAKRGYKDEEITAERFFCAPLAAGYLGIPEEEGRRLLKVQCFDEDGSKTNIFAKPVEGLTAVVDLHEGKVVQLHDTGVVPVPSNGFFNYDEESVAAATPLRDPLKPTRVKQPDGRNFAIEGGTVAWQNWSFHMKMDRRQGLILSTVTYNDAGKARPVLYQGALSEIFVPYMDPDQGWAFKTYMDAGEYGFGLLSSSLLRGPECPEHGESLSALVAFDDGVPHQIPDLICVFERDASTPAWRHSEFFNSTHESRQQVDLVVRTAATIGNYDYFVDWVFTQRGEIRIDVGATGIDITKAVASQSMSDPTAATDTAYGTLAAPGLVLPNHDHWFNFRLDFDVDGTKNQFFVDSLKTRRLENNPRKSLWAVESTVAKTESEGQVKAGGHGGPALYRVVSSDARNHVGNPTSYQIMGMGHASQLLSDDDPALQRAAFAKNALWVTPYDPKQIYAGGSYPNQATGEDGLAAWTAANRPIENTDLVVWYTIGFHHVTASEDWPVLPMMWHSILLRPFNFFDRNPAINLRREVAAN